VVIGAAVHVSIGVDGVGGRVHGIAGALAGLIGLVRVIEALATVKGIMSILVADLASGLAIAMSTTTTAMALSTTIDVTVGGRTTVSVSRLSTSSIGQGRNLIDRAITLDAHLHTHHMGKEVVQTNRVVTRGDGGDRGLSTWPETVQHVAENFLIRERMPEGGHSVGVAFHLLKIDISSHTCLLGVGELIAHLHDLGTVLGGEHGMQRRSHDFSGGVLGHLA
jgi:hypothetical protein